MVYRVEGILTQKNMRSFGEHRYVMKLMNKKSSKVYKSFVQLCDHLQQFHAGILVTTCQPKILVNAPINLPLNSKITANLTIELLHSPERVVWTLDSICQEG